jgi:hypothetical protein
MIRNTFDKGIKQFVDKINELNKELDNVKNENIELKKQINEINSMLEKQFTDTYASLFPSKEQSSQQSSEKDSKTVTIHNFMSASTSFPLIPMSNINLNPQPKFKNYFNKKRNQKLVEKQKSNKVTTFSNIEQSDTDDDTYDKDLNREIVSKLLNNDPLILGNTNDNKKPK